MQSCMRLLRGIFLKVLGLRDVTVSVSPIWRCYMHFDVGERLCDILSSCEVLSYLKDCRSSTVR